MRHEVEFEELFREGTDYGELLRRGTISRPGGLVIVARDSVK
jgi:hypothetical protein